jgi:hypothetical protein
MHVAQASDQRVLIAAPIEIASVAQIAIMIVDQTAIQTTIAIKIAKIVFKKMEPRVVQTAIATAIVDDVEKVRATKAHRATIATSHSSKR